MAELEIDIQGPPGAGKTRQIQHLADGAILESGPTGFGAVTFTRAAARELRSRLGHRVGTDNPRALEKAIPYVGTIHSLAWRLLDRPPVVTNKLLREFASDQRIALKNPSTSEYDSDPDFVDGIQFQEASADMDELKLMRAMLSGIRSRLWDPLDEVTWAELLPERTPAGITIQRLHKLAQKYTEWKHLRGLVDFEDMLEHGREQHPPVETLFLDEAQDCTPLLWSVIDAWAEWCKTFIAAGDPYQSIYLFGGANPLLFRDRPGRWLRLGKAHRFDRSAADYAKMVLRMGGWVSERDEAFHNAWDGVGPAESDGSTFYLARTNRLLDPIRGEFEADGTPYWELRGRAPLQQNAAAAFLNLRRYLDERMISASAVRQIVEALDPAPRGAAGRAARLADGAMLGPPEVDGVVGAPLSGLWGLFPHADYFDTVYAQHGPEAFTEAPKTHVGTIHASKGLQADSVRLVRSWARLPARNAMRNPEEEALVAYVGVTRHRSRLELLEGHQGTPYEFP